jgi:hypothetical protein
MRRLKLFATAAATLAATAAAALPAGAQADEHHGGGAVFVQSNDPAGNAIIAYSRAADGALTRVGQVDTGGRGGAQVGAPTDPIASQGSLVLDRARDLLLVVNAGSDTVSVLKVDGTTVRLRQVISSGGQFPVGITVRRHRVYVLNGGGDGNVTGFRLTHDHLQPLADASRALGLGNNATPFFLTSPAQIGLSPDGRQLLVTTKRNGVVDDFAVARSGALSAAPVQTATGPVPFAFVFDAVGRLVLADASGATNTFDLSAAGVPVPHGTSVSNGQAAQCWIVGARGFFYSANTGSSTITGYAESASGQLSLLSADGVSAHTDAGPLDLDATPDGRFLYELNGKAGTIGIFSVAADGALTQIGTVPGLHGFDGANGPQGLVVSG